jgi:CRP-like cAMP-binding protein
LGLFARAALSQRGVLVRHFRLEPLHARETLFRAADGGEYVYIVRSGLVKLVHPAATGKEKIVRLVRRGDTLGMEAVLQLPYRHTAVAVTESNLCQIPVRVVREHQRDNSAFMDDLLKDLQGTLDRADSFLSEFAVGSSMARVARLIRFLSGDAGSGECMLISREDMGELLGITTETASRAVAELRRKGVINSFTERETCRCDFAALERIAES